MRRHMRAKQTGFLAAARGRTGGRELTVHCGCDGRTGGEGREGGRTGQDGQADRQAGGLGGAVLAVGPGDIRWCTVPGSGR